MARVSTSDDQSTTLSRAEMAFVGIPANEMPFLRDYARSQVRHRLWGAREMLQRQKLLFDLVRVWVATLPEGRKKRVQPAFDDAFANWERSVRRLSNSGARKLPVLPDPMETGSTPTVDDGEGEADDNASNERARGRRGAADRKDTDGEERWDPAWGDPNTELPPPLPQGMTRLPTAVPKKPKR